MSTTYDVVERYRAAQAEGRLRNPMDGNGYRKLTDEEVDAHRACLARQTAIHSELERNATDWFTGKGRPKDGSDGVFTHMRVKEWEQGMSAKARKLEDESQAIWHVLRGEERPGAQMMLC